MRTVAGTRANGAKGIGYLLPCIAVAAAKGIRERCWLGEETVPTSTYGHGLAVRIAMQLIEPPQQHVQLVHLVGPVALTLARSPHAVATPNDLSNWIPKNHIS